MPDSVPYSDRNSVMIFSIFFNANFLSRNKEPKPKNCGKFFLSEKNERYYIFLILICSSKFQIFTRQSLY